MSFSSEIKAELCRLENKKECCARAECYGLWLFSKCFTLQDSATLTEHAGVARRMMELAAQTAGVAPELSYGVRRRQRAYRVSLPDPEDRRRLLEAFGHTGREASRRINRGLLEEDHCQRAFLRGAFLACGSATDPQKEYHLEFAVPTRNLANGLYTLLGEVEALSGGPAFAGRKGKFVVYWKDGAQIEDALTYLGATGASMEMMQVRMYKETRNDINRKANFETANMDKTFSASARQTAAIAALSDAGQLARLPQGLRELAQLRLHYPDMSLRELAQRLGLSRSGVNHRLARLVELGEKYIQG